MHEFSLCEAMVNTLLEEYDRQAVSRQERRPAVARVSVVVGSLHQIVEESFRMAYEALTIDTPFAGSILEMEKTAVTARCRECGWEGPLTVPFFICGRCGQGGLEILSGKEFYIKEMELDTDGREDL